MSDRQNQPNGWQMAKVRQVFDVIGGGTPSTKVPEYWGGDIPWVTSADLGKDLNASPRKFITKAAVDSSATNLVPNDSVIVATRVGLGKVAIADRPTCFSQDCQALLPSPEVVLPRFIAHQLSVATREFLHTGRGTTISGVTKKQLLDVEVRYPDLTQQRMIVWKIEELFSDLDAGVTALERAKANLARYRAAVLKAAVEGKLTEEWRRENPDVEPASELLKRILVERREQWEHAQVARYKVKGKKLPTDLKDRYVAPKEAQPLGSLPRGWSWATVDQLTARGRKVAYGVLQPGRHVEGGVPFVRVTDINDGRINEAGLKRISPSIDKRYPRTKLEGGEVVLTVVGTIGRSAVVPPELRGANTARAVAVIPISSLVEPRWVELVLRDPRMQARLTRAAHEVARKTLNLEDVRPAVIPLPPLREQREVVLIVERLLSEADLAARYIDDSVNKSRTLRGGILRHAFTGKLA